MCGLKLINAAFLRVLLAAFPSLRVPTTQALQFPQCFNFVFLKQSTDSDCYIYKNNC